MRAPDDATNDLDKDCFGLCQSLSKPYLRLTSAPDPNKVRPLSVLMAAYKFHRSRFAADEINYDALVDELKSIRQDMKVQHISNSFTVQVYEFSARAALESGNLDDLSQCLSSVSDLATLNNVRQDPACADEFKAYRLLLCVVRDSLEDVTPALAACLTPPVTAAARHAVEVLQAVTLRDYATFFRRYDNAPFLSAYLLDFLVARMRCAAYDLMLCSFLTLPLQYVVEQLSFFEREECECFLRGRGGIIVNDGADWDCKATRDSAGAKAN